jgi:hypothetical protein
LAVHTNEIFKQAKVTIGLDLGDRFSHYCILDEAGNVILEHNLPTTPKGIDQVFRKVPRSRIAPRHAAWSLLGRRPCQKPVSKIELIENWLLARGTVQSNGK